MRSTLLPSQGMLYTMVLLLLSILVLDCNIPPLSVSICGSLIFFVSFSVGCCIVMTCVKGAGPVALKGGSGSSGIPTYLIWGCLSVLIVHYHVINGRKSLYVWGLAERWSSIWCTMGKNTATSTCMPRVTTTAWYQQDRNPWEYVT